MFKLHGLRILLGIIRILLQCNNNFIYILRYTLFVYVLNKVLTGLYFYVYILYVNNMKEHNGGIITHNRW